MKSSQILKNLSFQNEKRSKQVQKFSKFIAKCIGKDSEACVQFMYL